MTRDTAKRGLASIVSARSPSHAMCSVTGIEQFANSCCVSRASPGLSSTRRTWTGSILLIGPWAIQGHYRFDSIVTVISFEFSPTSVRIDTQTYF